MLTRYQIVRGKRSPDNPLPDGVRIDVRKHTRHVLRPEADAVAAFLARPTEAEFEKFVRRYRTTLEARFRADRVPFDELASAAEHGDVYLGCNCPTKTNPDVGHCHTTAALRFMKTKYPRLRVHLPK
jgi:uncharacterized protein YeaO (DUF488 family)